MGEIVGGENGKVERAMLCSDEFFSVCKKEVFYMSAVYILQTKNWHRV